jgi:hypothetical protein
MNALSFASLQDNYSGKLCNDNHNIIRDMFERFHVGYVVKGNAYFNFTTVQLRSVKNVIKFAVYGMTVVKCVTIPVSRHSKHHP